MTPRSAILRAAFATRSAVMNHGQTSRLPTALSQTSNRLLTDSRAGKPACLSNADRQRTGLLQALRWLSDLQRKNPHISAEFDKVISVFQASVIEIQAFGGRVVKSSQAAKPQVANGPEVAKARSHMPSKPAALGKVGYERSLTHSMDKIRTLEDTQHWLDTNVFPPEIQPHFVAVVNKYQPISKLLGPDQEEWKALVASLKRSAWTSYYNGEDWAAEIMKAVFHDGGFLKQFEAFRKHVLEQEDEALELSRTTHLRIEAVAPGAACLARFTVSGKVTGMLSIEFAPPSDKRTYVTKLDIVPTDTGSSALAYRRRKEMKLAAAECHFSVNELLFAQSVLTLFMRIVFPKAHIVKPFPPVGHASEWSAKRIRKGPEQVYAFSRKASVTGNGKAHKDKSTLSKTMP